MKHPTLIELTVLLYSSIIGHTIYTTWGDHPMMQFGSIAFGIWVFPLVYYILRKKKASHEVNFPFLLAAILFSTAGWLGSLRAASYIGLSCALAGLAPLSYCSLFWWCTAATWMPAASYFLHFLSATEITICRLLVVSAGAFCAWMQFNRTRTLP